MAPAQYPCPHCGAPMSWSYVNQQWYCNRCELFIQGNAPLSSADAFNKELSELSGKTPVQKHPSCLYCSAPLNYIPQYQRWFCYNCNRWAQ
jgi:hypothetical protein